jgi:hypothetical protein
MQIDFPCVCGHLKKDHDEGYSKGYCGICYNKLTIRQLNSNDTSWHHEFKFDNLKYLEQLSEK